MHLIYWILFAVACMVISIYVYLSAITIDEQPYQEYHLQHVRFSVQGFYNAIESTYQQQHIKGLTVYRFIRREGGLFSRRREYLRIKYRALYVEVCAFGYGDGMSVTCRRGIKEYVRRILVSRSWYGQLLKAIFFAKTFYRRDAEHAFKRGVDACITDSINRLTSAYGARGFEQFVNMHIV